MTDRISIVLALRSACRAQQLLWDRQRNLAQRLGQLDDAQDASMCAFVQEMAVGDGPFAAPDRVVDALRVRVFGSKE